MEFHPDPSVKWVKTHEAGCLSGVKYIKAIQIPIVAQTEIVSHTKRRYEKDKYILLMGANQRMILCNVFVVSEQITPRTQSMPIDSKTVSSAVLAGILICKEQAR